MSGVEASENRYRIEALARGLRVLSAFDGQPLRVGDLAQRTGMSLGTCFRVVATLEEFDFLEKLPDGRVRPGIGALRLGSAATRSSSLLEASDRPLRNLAESTGQTVNLGVLTQDRVLYLVRIRNADLVTANVQVGSTLPAPYASMGKVLLAYLEPSEVRRRLTPESFPERAGPRAIRSIEALLAHLDEVRTQGYAVQNQEMAAGLQSLAVPVLKNEGGPVAAINVAVSGYSPETQMLIDEYHEPCKAAAREIAVRLEGS